MKDPLTGTQQYRRLLAVRGGDAWEISFIVKDYFGFPRVLIFHTMLNIVLSRLQGRIVLGF